MSSITVSILNPLLFLLWLSYKCLLSQFVSCTVVMTFILTKVVNCSKVNFCALECLCRYVPSLSFLRIRPTSLVHLPPPAVVSKMRSSITTLSAREGLSLTGEELQRVQLEAEKRYQVSYMAVVGHSWQTTKVATVLRVTYD